MTRDYSCQFLPHLKILLDVKVTTLAHALLCAYFHTRDLSTKNSPLVEVLFLLLLLVFFLLFAFLLLSGCLANSGPVNFGSEKS